jgi:hypothetical protein
MSIAQPLHRIDAAELWVWRAYLSATATLLAVKCLNRDSRIALAAVETPGPFALARIHGFCELERRLALRLATSTRAFTVEEAGAFLGARWWMQPPPAQGGELVGVAFERLLVCLVALLSSERWRGSPRCMAASLWGRDGPADRFVSAAVYDLPSSWPAALGPPLPGAIGGARWPDGSPRALLVDGAAAPRALRLPGAPVRRASPRRVARSRSR